jgi:hypothetical protein
VKFSCGAIGAVGRTNVMYLVRVAADDEQGLRLWLSAGSPYWRLVAEDDVAHGESDDRPDPRHPAGALHVDR